MLPMHRIIWTALLAVPLFVQPAQAQCLSCQGGNSGAGQGGNCCFGQGGNGGFGLGCLFCGGEGACCPARLHYLCNYGCYYGGCCVGKPAPWYLQFPNDPNAPIFVPPGMAWPGPAIASPLPYVGHVAVTPNITKSMGNRPYQLQEAQRQYMALSAAASQQQQSYYCPMQAPSYWYGR
jgi:hypothetical protein